MSPSLSHSTHEKVAWISQDITQPVGMQSQLNIRIGAKAEALACGYCSAELYSIPHIISHSFYGPCHHASRSINALSPAVCSFTPNSHPSNKFHPSPPLRSPPFTGGPNSCSPNITCPLWERRRRRGEKEGTKGRGKVIQTEREHPSFSPLPLLSLLPPDCLGCVLHCCRVFSWNRRQIQQNSMV